MIFHYGDSSPIIACSTGDNMVASIAVIRISGFSELSSLQPCFDCNLKKIVARRVYRSNILYNGESLDDVLITYFKAPHSFTGENILEISCHGNRLNITRIIEAFVKICNLRIAERGEFTYRAYRNKKLTLSQVEGLDLFIHANSHYALNQGLQLIHGELHKIFLELREKFLNLKSSMELAIDFSEDVGVDETHQLIHNNFNNYFALISKLKDKINISQKSLLSPEIVFFGKPNAGKSTLFNALFGEARSIISHEAGTTRDYISEYINLYGNTFKLVDTAGVRHIKGDTAYIENQGIERAYHLAQNAFFRILVIKPNEWENNLEDKKDFDRFDYDLIFFTHADKDDFKNSMEKIKNSLPNFSKAFFTGSIEPTQFFTGPIEPDEIKSGSIEPTQFFTGPIEPDEIKSGSIEPAQFFTGPIEPDEIKSGSIEPAHFFTGSIEPDEIKSGSIEPKNLVFDEIINKFNDLTSENPLLIERHKQVILDVYRSSSDFQKLMKNCDDMGILVSELSLIERNISGLIGITVADDVLNHIFSNFCIGK